MTRKWGRLRIDDSKGNSQEKENSTAGMETNCSHAQKDSDCRDSCHQPYPKNRVTDGYRQNSTRKQQHGCKQIRNCWLGVFDRDNSFRMQTTPRLANRANKDKEGKTETRIRHNITTQQQRNQPSIKQDKYEREQKTRQKRHREGYKMGDNLGMK